MSLMTPSTLLTLEGVSVTRSLPGLERLKALEGVSWRWNRGECWALRGANGSGKSTLLRLIRGELWPDADGGKRTYSFEGVSKTSPLSVKDRIALISPETQDWYLSSGWALSVRQVISTGFFNELLPHRILDDTQQTRLLEVAQNLQVDSWLERDVRSLSNGQRRQVLLARALVGNPLALLLDEFFEGIDSDSSARLRLLMKDLSREIPTVYTGHRNDGTLEFASHELWLEGGRVLRLGEVAQGAGQRKDSFFQARVEGPILERVPVLFITPWVQLENVSVKRGEKTVLESVSWTLESHQDWVLLGHNGAGKSTLAKIIRRELYPLQGGRVRHFGVEGGSSWKLWQRIPLVSSEGNVLHRVSAAGLSAPGKTLVASGFEAWIGYSPVLEPLQEEKVLEWMDYFEVSHLHSRPANQMSAGELKRCLLARAMVNDPNLLILDEPFDYLDSVTKRKLTKLISRLERTRFVLIAHRLEDIPESATHLIRLEGGRVLEQGKLDFAKL